MLNSQYNFHDYGLPKPNASSHTDIMTNINFLYQKMQECTRNVTYFDLYKVTSVLNNETEFDAQINALSPYSTMVINTPVVTGDGSQYNIGDMVIKHNDGTHDIIRAQRGGIFWPSKITTVHSDDDDATDVAKNNFTYDFQFSYTSVAPSITIPQHITGVQDLITKITTWDGTAHSNKQNLVYDRLQSGIPEAPYNLVFRPAKLEDLIIEIEAAMSKDTTPVPIPPKVHLYHEATSNKREELYTDLNIEFIAATQAAAEGDNPESPAKYRITISASLLCNLVVVK